MQCSPLRIQVVKLGRGDASRAVKHSRKRGTVGVFQLLPLHRDRQVQTRSRAEFHPDADDVSSWRALSPLTTRRCNKGLAEAKPLFYLVRLQDSINHPIPCTYGASRRAGTILYQQMYQQNSLPLRFDACGLFLLRRKRRRIVPHGLAGSRKVRASASCPLGRVTKRLVSRVHSALTSFTQRSGTVSL